MGQELLIITRPNEEDFTEAGAEVAEDGTKAEEATAMEAVEAIKPTSKGSVLWSRADSMIIILSVAGSVERITTARPNAGSSPTIRGRRTSLREAPNLLPPGRNPRVNLRGGPKAGSWRQSGKEAKQAPARPGWPNVQGELSLAKAQRYVKCPLISP